jgi:hypothetical protein
LTCRYYSYRKIIKKQHLSHNVNLAYGKPHMLI